MNRHFTYPCNVTRDEAGFWLVTFPDVPEAGTDDRDRKIALAEAGDALAAALEGYVGARRAIPLPSAPERGQDVVSLSPLMAAKVALYEAMRDQRVSNSEMARRLGVTETIIRRMIDLRHTSRIEPVCNALALLGKRLMVEVRDAAA